MIRSEVSDTTPPPPCLADAVISSNPPNNILKLGKIHKTNRKNVFFFSGNAFESKLLVGKDIGKVELPKTGFR